MRRGDQRCGQWGVNYSTGYVQIRFGGVWNYKAEVLKCRAICREGIVTLFVVSVLYGKDMHGVGIERQGRGVVKS